MQVCAVYFNLNLVRVVNGTLSAGISKPLLLLNGRFNNAPDIPFSI
jgi:hypothetical protein